MAISLGTAAGLASLGGGIAGLVGGSPASNVQYPGAFSFPGGGAASSGALSGINNLAGFNLYDIPNATNVSYGLFNNPYAPQTQAGAGTAGAMGTAGAANEFGAGGALYGAGGTMLNNVFNNQPQLYNYLQNQNFQQANAQNAASGVAGTPYGAGVADQSNQLFNLNWQNFIQGQQLAALGGANNAFQGGAQLQAAAPGQYLSGASLPYSTFGMIGGNQLGALSNLGQFGTSASGIGQQQVQDYLGYLGAGSGAQNAATGQFNAQLNQANLANQETMGYGQAIGGGLGFLANAYGRSNPYGFGQNSAPIYTTGANYGVPSYSPYANYPEV